MGQLLLDACRTTSRSCRFSIDAINFLAFVDIQLLLFVSLGRRSLVHAINICSDNKQLNSFRPKKPTQTCHTFSAFLSYYFYVTFVMKYALWVAFSINTNKY
uniref:Uncharacterized protein n=1 Tax=Physcomitrium patens TaxID=3218 RepID=A0A2K1JI74_PHYPA|nr:hypothetical protein PHYPA_018658 [Physcomitrium patens]